MCLALNWGFKAMKPIQFPDLGLQAVYFDGQSARPHPVTLHLQSQMLLIKGQNFECQVPVKMVRWPERTRHAVRIAHFEHGGAVQCTDASRWDEWCERRSVREPLVVRMQQSWRWVAAAAVALAAVLIVLQQWGLPIAARGMVAVTPMRVDVALGESALAFVDQHLMMPSRLPSSEQARLRFEFERVLRHSSMADVPRWDLVFRQSRFGPNALALPGGTLIMSDELVALLGADAAMISGVLAHELGHVQHRHGLRMLVQTTLLGAAAATAFGDFSSVFAGVPVWLGQAAYSRDAEREADAAAVRTLRAADLSPLVMVTVFEKLDAYLARKHRAGTESDASDKSHSPGLGGISFASHPATSERTEFFRQAAGKP
jgi:Zn-dependent protease with chaperone function